MSNKDQNKLTEMEIDVIGEVMNISMGAAATALSSILDQKVSITTPRLEEIPIQDFEFAYLEPVMGVLIKYVDGFDGTNMLLLREEDMRKMLDQLLGVESDMTEDLDEISISAICEIMNQMMGSAASALASFFTKMVNISPPEIIDPTKSQGVKELFSLKGDSVVSIKFHLNIEGVLDSEFISAMEPQLAKEMVEMSYRAGEEQEGQQASSAEQIPMPEAAAPVSLSDGLAGTPSPAVPQGGGDEQAPALAGLPDGQFSGMAPAAEYGQAMSTPAYGQAPLQPMYGQMPPAEEQAQQAYHQMQMQQSQQAYPQMQMPQPSAYGQMPPQIYGHSSQPVYNGMMPPTEVVAAPYAYKPLNAAARESGTDNNLDLIMSVPVQVTVELGRTRKKIKDIVDLTIGNIVELDRQAGDQVDVVANGKLIARGDVVVVDDNYSVRITEIVKTKDMAAE